MLYLADDVVIETSAVRAGPLSHTSHAHRMSTLAGAALKKKQELHECLRKLDPDGSGSISVALLADAMRRIGINFTLEDLTKELLSNDADGDGNMEVHEVDQFLDVTHRDADAQNLPTRVL